MEVMNIETRKLSIINWVSHLQDESILAKIETLQSQKQDWWDLISAEEKEEIEEGIAQADRGETKTTEEVLSKYKKWL
jgi:predicted transcriptional regulator